MNKFFCSLLIVIQFSSYCLAGQDEEADEAGKSNTNAQAVVSTKAAKASKRLLMDIQRVGESKLIAVGERGHILISEDEANSWRQVIVPTQVLLTKLLFVNEKIGWAIGHQQNILKTEDGGESWTLKYENASVDQPALFDIWFKDENFGIAVGAYGLYLRTDDGGETWEDIYQESLEDVEIGFTHFYGITFDQSSEKLFMAGELGFLAISGDYGESWERIESPYHGSFFGIEGLPNGRIIAFGLRGHLFWSDDLGQTWEQSETGTTSGLQRALMLNSKSLLIVGSDGTQLISKDNAETVKLYKRSDRVHLASAVKLESDEILLVGVNGVMKADFSH
ncbi:YCF48-related protein [Aliikangiella sp. G2MR2-5]|uniref:WD40/YVTN/BNR-like repeat-containing protein n=1 Tax=Aliikangiella sp. G2MR2-5 TaxID=2788943 RepID=UPI0018A9214F|nr:YCF48-related protein [Aliikangiella sp. G2MR2-5]